MGWAIAQGVWFSIVAAFVIGGFFIPHAPLGVKLGGAVFTAGAGYVMAGAFTWFATHTWDLLWGLFIRVGLVSAPVPDALPGQSAQASCEHQRPTTADRLRRKLLEP